jgi:hypothetical protein
MIRTVLTATALVAGLASAASALTLTTSAEGIVAAKAAEAAFLAGKTVAASETFEGFTDGDRPAGFSFLTGVGTFTDNDPRTIHGGTGFGILSSGTTPFVGRFNTTGGGALWLDSFDSRKVTLSLSLPSNTTGLGFFMTDLDDQGADTQLEVLDSLGGLIQSFDLVTSGTADGRVFYYALAFGGADVAALRFTHSDTNDGWGIDDLTAVAPIPLPAAGWMLIAGVGALAGVARRRRS